jgi:tetratricopeptide (TPR) repeat protein
MTELEEERDFLLRSIEDLEREREAGDVDEHDYAALKDDYTVRAAATLRAIEQPAAAPVAPRRSLARSAGWLALVLVVAVLAAVLVTQSAGRRDAGETVTGDIRSTVRGKLDEAVAAGERADLERAVELYGEVLDEQPSNVEALAYLGWFIARASETQLDRGAGLIEDAVALDPEYGDAKVFLAYVMWTRGDAAGAAALLDEADDLATTAYADTYGERLRSEL